MQECNKDFFTLIFDITKLEAEYEELQEEHKHLEYLYYSFWKENENKRSMIRYNMNNKEHEIEALRKEIAKFELDDVMKKYYELYQEKDALIKKYWNIKTELGYIHATFIFDCACDEEQDKKLANKRDDFEKEKAAIRDQIGEINIKMGELHPNAGITVNL